MTFSGGGASTLSVTSAAVTSTGAAVPSAIFASFSLAVEIRSTTSILGAAGAGSTGFGGAFAAGGLIPEIGLKTGFSLPGEAARGFRAFGPSINDSVSTGAVGAAGSAGSSAAVAEAAEAAAGADFDPAGFFAAGVVVVRFRVVGLLLLAGGEERGMRIWDERKIGRQSA